MFFQKALHRVRCNHQIILPDYLAWWFRYNCDYGGFSALAGAKATIAHLPGAKLKSSCVAVPPMELQEAICCLRRSNRQIKKLQCGNIKNLLERRSLSWK